MKNFRRETDPLGEVLVADDRPYGAHETRALENFPVKLPGHAIGDYAPLVRSLVMVKLAAATYRCECSLDFLLVRVRKNARAGFKPA